MYPYIAQSLAAAHDRDLRAEAAGARRASSFRRARRVRKPGAVAVVRARPSTPTCA